MLAKANILSAPLVVENGLEDSGSPTFRESGSFGQAVIGWIDVADLVAALLSREWRSPCASAACHAAHMCALSDLVNIIASSLAPSSHARFEQIYVKCWVAWLRPSEDLHTDAAQTWRQRGRSQCGC